jgi:phosphoglycolate phosphatase-like HAD superfamily hydrolase
MHDERLLIVFDVDNTLYDWVRLWAGAFSTMLQTLATSTGRDVEYWANAAHAIHMRRGATECPSLLCDLASAVSWPAATDAKRVLPAAASAYRAYWDHHLTTYSGIRESLTALSEQGHALVAYTEGDVSIAASRLSRLGLAGFIRRVFGRSPLPASSEPSWCPVNVNRNLPIAMDFVPREDSKPNPTGLRTIVAMCDALPHHTVYVGDNLWKDIVMARTLGAGAIWARYGAVRDQQHVALLNRVAHWTPQAVAAERNVTVDTVRPDGIVDDPHDLPRAIAERALAAL